MSIDRLYGLPDAEELHADPAWVWELDIEPYLEADEMEPVVIEEWDVHEPIEHLPSVEVILDYIAEWTAEMGEVSEHWGFPVTEEIKELTQKLREKLASQVHYRMAKSRVAEHTLALVEGKPHLDGEPLYRHVNTVTP
jgi:hypothetical protein